MLDFATGRVVGPRSPELSVAAASIAGDGTLAAVDIDGGVHFLTTS